MDYVIIGNGVAGISAALALREQDPDASITVISGESDYFFARTALMYALMGRMSLRDLEPHERSHYSKQRITRIRAWVRDLDADSHRLTLSDGRVLPYHRLLIATGSVPIHPSWRGLERATTGVTHFVGLDDLARCEALLPSTQRAVVAGGGLIGIELVECLVYHRIPVTFLVREQTFWPKGLSRKEGELVAAHIRKQGVDLRFSEEVDEVLSDATGRVSSVVTAAGRSHACEFLGVSIGVQPQIAWLRNVRTPPLLGRGIMTDRDFKTSLPDIYAAGDCAEVSGSIEPLWYAARRQGELAARAMLGNQVAYHPPSYYNSARFFHLEYTCVGEAGTESAGYFWRIPEREASIRVTTRDGIVTGFSMLGARWDHRVLESWIESRLPLTSVLPRLGQAQFNPEFESLPLSTVRA